MADYFCHICGERTSMMGHKACQERKAKPRFRVLSNGWVRHDGDGMPSCLAQDTPVKVRGISGNYSFMDGLPACVFGGWRHRGFSSDIMLWKLATPFPSEGR